MTTDDRRRSDASDPERGSASTEAVLNALLLVVFLAFGVGIARLVETHALVDEAANQAARAASLASMADAALSASQSAGEQLVGQATCPDPRVHTRYAPSTASAGMGGAEIVEVSCTVPLSDLFFAGFPGHETLTSTEAAPRNPYQQAG